MRKPKAIFPLGLYHVAGESMAPTYRPDDLLLGLRWFRPRTGQVVVASADLMVIKRIERMERDQIWLSGDNRVLSSATRQIASDKVRALIIYRLKKGRLPG